MQTLTEFKTLSVMTGTPFSPKDTFQPSIYTHFITYQETSNLFDFVFYT